MNGYAVRHGSKEVFLLCQCVAVGDDWFVTQRAEILKGNLQLLSLCPTEAAAAQMEVEGFNAFVGGGTVDGGEHLRQATAHAITEKGHQFVGGRFAHLACEVQLDGIVAPHKGFVVIHAADGGDEEDDAEEKGDEAKGNGADDETDSRGQHGFSKPHGLGVVLLGRRCFHDVYCIICIVV